MKGQQYKPVRLLAPKIQIFPLRSGGAMTYTEYQDVGNEILIGGTRLTKFSIN